MDILGIAAEIDQRQARTLAVRVSEGQIRAVELRWRTMVRERHGIAVTPFTARDRQNLRLMLSGFEIPEALRLLEGAVEHWPSLRREPYLSRLAPTPIFRDLFWARDHIQSFLVEMERRQEQQRKMNEQYFIPPPQLSDPEMLPEESNVPEPPRLSLSGMVLDARKKLREEKKEVTDGGR